MLEEKGAFAPVMTDHERSSVKTVSKSLEQARRVYDGAVFEMKKEISERDKESERFEFWIYSILPFFGAADLY